MRNIKIVTVGDGACGKTSLLISFSTNSFPADYCPTVFDNYAANLMVPIDMDGGKKRPFTLSLWDTAGQEEYNQLRVLSYPQTDVFLIGYNIISNNSFINVTERWIPELSHHNPHTPIVLVGMKSDLRDDPKMVARLEARGEAPITTEQGEKLAKQIGAQAFIETSALKQHNVLKLFQIAVNVVIDQENDKKKKPNNSNKCAIL